MSIYALTPWFGWSLTAAVCGSAFWRGTPEERIAAGAVLFSAGLTLATRDWSWTGTQWGAFACDVVLFGILTALALRSTRYWPLFAAGFQLLAVATHFGEIVDPGVRAWAYASAQILWTWFVLLAIGAGVYGTWRAERQAAAGLNPAAGATRR
jgi:hypothetical protein